MNIRDKSIDELELTARSFNCLKNAQIRTLGELVEKTEAELLRSRNFGRKSLNELREVLAEYGLHFGMGGDDDTPTLVRKSNNPRQPSGAHRLPIDDD
jgi:DNA-directed RNA polymerase subunit alpha